MIVTTASSAYENPEGMAYAVRTTKNKNSRHSPIREIRVEKNPPLRPFVTFVFRKKNPCNSVQSA